MRRHLPALLLLTCCVQQEQPAAKNAQLRPAQTSIRIVGSEAMKPLNGRFAAAYTFANHEVTLRVGGRGTTAGLEALASGQADIAAASRPITPEERALIESKRGAKVVEIPVAYDVVALYVNNANRVSELTPQQVIGIVSGTTKRWNEVGGSNAPIVVYGQGDKRDFTNYLGQPPVPPRPARDFAVASETIAAVAADPNGFGYAGLVPNGQAKVVALKRGGAAVPPSSQSVADHTYPMAAQFAFYTLANAPDPVKRFIDWTRSPAGKKVLDDEGAIAIR